MKRPVLEIFQPRNDSDVGSGTVTRGNATCPVTGHTTRVNSVRDQLKRRQGGASDARLFAVVTTLTTKRYTGRREEKHFRIWDEQGRFYRLPTQGDEEAYAAAGVALAEWKKRALGGDLSIVPDEEISLNELRRISVPIYGMKRWGDLFSSRQALALATLTRLVGEVGARMNAEPGPSADRSFSPGLTDAVLTCLTMIIGRQADYGSSLCRWVAPGEFIGNTSAAKLLA